MEIILVACGVFRPELELVLPALAASEFPEHKIRAVYLEMALHNDIAKLKTALEHALAQCAGSARLIALYGSMCHPEIGELCARYHALLPRDKNCIGMYASEDEQQRLAGGTEMFFLTNGWFENWKDTLVGNGWDTYDARMNFGRYDSFLLLNAQEKEYSDEEIIDFFEYTTVPIEIEPIRLDRFTGRIRALLREAVAMEGVTEKPVHTRTSAM